MSAAHHGRGRTSPGSCHRRTSSALLRNRTRPVRNTRVVGATSAGKSNPSVAYPSRQGPRFVGSTGLMRTSIRVVEHEWHFTSMERSRSTVQHARFPRKRVNVGRRCSQRGFSCGLRHRIDPIPQASRIGGMYERIVAESLKLPPRPGASPSIAWSNTTTRSSSRESRLRRSCCGAIATRCSPTDQRPL